MLTRAEKLSPLPVLTRAELAYQYATETGKSKFSFSYFLFWANFFIINWVAKCKHYKVKAFGPKIRAKATIGRQVVSNTFWKIVRLYTGQNRMKFAIDEFGTDWLFSSRFLNNYRENRLIDWQIRQWQISLFSRRSIKEHLSYRLRNIWATLNINRRNVWATTLRTLRNKQHYDVIVIGNKGKNSELRNKIKILYWSTK